MAREFAEFLQTRGIVSAESVQRIRNLVSRVREPIGSIAFSYGLLTVDDVDRILAEQRREHRQFGEIAADLGILTGPQVEALIHIQEAREAAQTAEAVILAGIADHEAVLPTLGEFLHGNSASGRVRNVA